MRSGFSVLLIATILFGGGYFYYIAQAVCPTPITYRIGVLDDKFGLSYDEAKLAVSEASEVWEDATGRNLFSYRDDADFSINFIFDERQAFANAEERFKEKLDVAEDVSKEIGDTYAALIDQYNIVHLSYSDKVEVYERNLSLYNKKVTKYNEEGGAPPDAFEKLKQEKLVLDEEQYSLNQLAGNLSAMVREINSIGEKGNLLIETYNKGVGTYNKTFGESREFTQGDYQGDQINIYTYEDINELKLVLAHELGHALSLDHVSGQESVMFYLIGEQLADIALSQADSEEFGRVCGNISIWDKLKLRLNI